MCALLWVAAGCGSKKTDVPPPGDALNPPMTGDEPQRKADMSAGMRIVADPPTEILVDGKSVGMSPVTVEHLRPGTHDVTYLDEEDGNRTLQVTLEPGQFQEVYQAMPPKATDTKTGKEK